jgi:monooxygenase
MPTEGKRITVIGSGATAITLIPSLSATAKHVTLLQRSPTFIGSQPKSLALNFIERFLVAIGFERFVYVIRRLRYIVFSMYVYSISKAFPKLVAYVIIQGSF